MADDATSRTCARCGGDLASLAVGGLCAACLFRCALEEDGSDASYTVLALDPLSQGVEARPFGRFELFDLLGRGGMGVVYRARERATGRIVALKLGTPHLVAHEDDQRRFQAEMRAAASLDHPHVLPVFEVGERDGMPFFTMKLAEGGSLAARLGEFTGRPKEIATLLAAVARAVHHAHSRGILHRDLKPANILLGADGHPYVSDFGLVKWMTGDASLTNTSVVVGAPGYVAPEQARPRVGRAAGPASDIFSLGVVLYELLTGRKPFAATTLLDAIELVEDGSYTTPRLLAHGVPRDLETVCCKCLEADPDRRYATAELLAEDLERFLEGREIRARPVGTWGRTWRWARRNPWVAGLGAGLGLILAAGAVGSTLAAIHLANARDRAMHAEIEARERLWQALVSEARALRTSAEIGHRHRALVALQRAAEIRNTPELRDEAIRALTLTDVRSVAEWRSEIPFGAFTSDLEHYALELPDGSCEVRCTADHTTVARLPPRASKVFACWRFTPDGNTVSIIGKGGEAWLWRWREGLVVPIPYPLGQPPVCLEFSPDGRSIAAPAVDGGVALFDLEGRPGRVLVPHLARPWAFAFSPDGATLAVSERDSSDVTLVDIARGEATATLAHPATRAASCLGFSPDGRRLAVGTTDSAITVWSLPERQPLVLRGHSRTCEVLLFTPDSRILASSGYDQTVRFWNASRGEPLAVMPAANATLTFDPAGARLAISTEDARWAVLEFLANTVRHDLEPETHPDDRHPISLDLDHSGRVAALGGMGGIRIYDVTTRRQAAYLANPGAGRHDIAIDPGSGDVYATAGDSTLLCWSGAVNQVAAATPVPIASPQVIRTGEFRLAGLDPRGRRLALAHSDTGLTNVMPFPGASGIERELHHPAARNVVFDPKDRWMAVGGWKSPRVAIWSLEDMRHLHDVAKSDNATFAVGDDARSILVGTPSAYRIFDASDWTLRREIARPGSPLVTSYVAAAANASLAACQATHDSIRLLDLGTGEWIATLPVSVTTGLDLFRISDDSAWLVVAGEGHVLESWDLRALQRELTAVGLGWPELASRPGP